jgi:hypothetical protein
MPVRSILLVDAIEVIFSVVKTGRAVKWTSLLQSAVSGLWNHEPNMRMRDCGSKRSVCRHQGGMESILDRVKEENGFHFDQVLRGLPVVIARIKTALLL